MYQSSFVLIDTRIITVCWQNWRVRIPSFRRNDNGCCEVTRGGCGDDELRVLIDGICSIIMFARTVLFTGFILVTVLFQRVP